MLLRHALRDLNGEKSRIFFKLSEEKGITSQMIRTTFFPLHEERNIGWKWIERNFVYLTPTPKNHPPFNYGTPLGGRGASRRYRQSFEETTLLHVNAPTVPMNFSYASHVGPASSRSIIASNHSISIQSPAIPEMRQKCAFAILLWWAIENSYLFLPFPFYDPISTIIIIPKNNRHCEIDSIACRIENWFFFF